MSQAAAVPEPATRSLGAILADLYFAPSAAFADIARAPRFLLPLAVIVLLNVLFTAVWVSKLDVGEFIRGQIEASGQELTAEQVAGAVAMQEKIFRPLAFVGAFVGAPIMVLALGGILMFVYRSIFGSEITFRQSAAVIAWSFMPVSLVTTPALFAVFALRGDWSGDPQQAIQASPVLMLEKGDVPAALYTLAASLDLFTLWILFLMSVGYGVMVRRPASQAFWGVGSLWIGYVFVKVLWAATSG